MKYLISALLFIIIGVTGYRLLVSHKISASFATSLRSQGNPFAVAKDSGEIVWARVGEFFKKKGKIFTGGSLQKNDSVYYLPYYSRHKKGNCIRIERHAAGDSVTFSVQCWYSQQPSTTTAKEIALFMQKHIDIYDDK